MSSHNFLIFSTSAISWILSLLILTFKSFSIHYSERFVVVVVTRPLPRDGGMAEDHGAPEPGQLPSAWTRGHKETESRQRVSGPESPLLDSAE